MRRTILGLAAVFSLTAIPLSGQDFLVWNEGEPLHWRDFRGPVPADKPAYHGAESRLLIAVGLICTNGVGDLKISAEFDRIQSWARADMPTGLLEHEQIHFDIAEVHARRARKEAANVLDPCQNTEAIREIAERNQRLAAEMHDIYDEETHHGTRAEAQAEWSGRIRSLLSSR